MNSLSWTVQRLKGLATQCTKTFLECSLLDFGEPKTFSCKTLLKLDSLSLDLLELVGSIFCQYFPLQNLIFCHYSLYSLCFVWVHHGGVKHSFSLALYVDILRSKAYFWLLWRPFAEEELSTHSYLAYLCALLHDVCSLVWWRVCDGLKVYVAGLCRSDVSRRPNLVHFRHSDM